MPSASRAALALVATVLASCSRADAEGGHAAAKASASAGAPGLPATSFQVEAFRDWAAQARNSPRAVEGEEDCNGPEDTSAPTLCAKNFLVNESEAYSLNYDRIDSKAFLFSGLFRGVLAECSALGPSTTLREWRLGSSRKKLCEVSGGSLSGLRAVVEQQSDSSYIFLFSPEYLDHDRKFRQDVEQEGRP